MKKWFCLALSFVLLFTMGAFAFAASLPLVTVTVHLAFLPL